MKNDIDKRKWWICVLARTQVDTLEKYWSQMNRQPTFTLLRKPQTGLVMMRGRSGGTGKQFNFGEATVTRCSVSLENQTHGHAYIIGRNKRHAQLAALIDAMLQDEHQEPKQHWEFIQKLATGQSML